MLKKRYFKLFVLLSLGLVLTSCVSGTSHLSNSNNACVIFAERSGVFNNWRKSTVRSAARYQIPMGILLATIKAESSFRSTAKTRRNYVLGFIPWGRQSTAYGYAQALDGTWRHYEKATGKSFALRSSFADAVDFVAWYFRQTVQKTGISIYDYEGLYISYVVGWNAFARYGRNSANHALLRKAAEVAQLAKNYDWQLSQCQR